MMNSFFHPFKVYKKSTCQLSEFRRLKGVLLLDCFGHAERSFIGTMLQRCFGRGHSVTFIFCIHSWIHNKLLWQRLIVISYYFNLSLNMGCFILVKVCVCWRVELRNICVHKLLCGWHFCLVWEHWCWLRTVIVYSNICIGLDVSPLPQL